MDICLRAKGIKRECFGPPLRKADTDTPALSQWQDQIDKVMERFENKIGQLPKDKPGIVVVYANALVPFYVARDQVLEQIASKMVKSVTSKGNVELFVLVIPEGCFDNQNKYKITSRDSNHVIVQRPLFRGSRENILAVKNMNARFDCTSAHLDALLSP